MSSKILDYWPEVERVLVAIGHPDALVTDDSTVADFELTAFQRVRAQQLLQRPVRDDDPIHALAATLRGTP